MNNFIPIKGNFYRPIKLLAGTMLATMLSTQGVSAKNLMPLASKIKTSNIKLIISKFFFEEQIMV
jgi:hypothetical protein